MWLPEGGVVYLGIIKNNGYERNKKHSRFD